jgi:Zn-dependent oligopeptidase
MEATKYPPLTTAALVSYSHLGPFSEVVPAEKMAELERLLEEANKEIANLNGKLDRVEEYWN